MQPRTAKRRPKTCRRSVKFHIFHTPLVLRSQDTTMRVVFSLGCTSTYPVICLFPSFSCTAITIYQRYMQTNGRHARNASATFYRLLAARRVKKQCRYIATCRRSLRCTADTIMLSRQVITDLFALLIINARQNNVRRANGESRQLLLRLGTLQTTYTTS